MFLEGTIIEVENKETWSWFLELLLEDLGVLIYINHAHSCLTNKRNFF